MFAASQEHTQRQKTAGVFPNKFSDRYLVAVVFLGGVQLITIGIIGEYIARIYEEVKRRPLYIVRETVGLDNPLSRSPLPGEEKGTEQG